MKLRKKTVLERHSIEAIKPVMVVHAGGLIKHGMKTLRDAFEEVELLQKCSFHALSPDEKFRKADIEGIRDSLLNQARHEKVRVLCTVGPDVFKHLLGRGKKPSMKTLQGSVVYERLIDYKVVIALPDISPFELPFPESEPAFVQRRFTQWINNCALDLLECVKVVASTVGEL